MGSTTRPLRGRRIFSRMSASGTRVRRGLLTVVIGDPTAVPEVGFAIGKHVGGAVVRNKLRRRLRTLLDQHELPNRALLLRPQAAAANCTFAELRDAVDDALGAVDRIVLQLQVS